MSSSPVGVTLRTNNTIGAIAKSGVSKYIPAVLYHCHILSLPDIQVFLREFIGACSRCANENHRAGSMIYG